MEQMFFMCAQMSFLKQIYNWGLFQLSAINIFFFTDSVSETWLEKLLKIRPYIGSADWISML